MKRTLSYMDLFGIFAVCALASVIANLAWQSDINRGVAPSNGVN